MNPPFVQYLDTLHYATGINMYLSTVHSMYVGDMAATDLFEKLIMAPPDHQFHDQDINKLIWTELT